MVLPAVDHAAFRRTAPQGQNHRTYTPGLLDASFGKENTHILSKVEE